MPFKKIMVKEVIVIRGIPGTGKSTLAKEILEHYMNSGRFAVIISRDQVRKDYLRSRKNMNINLISKLTGWDPECVMYGPTDQLQEALYQASITDKKLDRIIKEEFWETVWTYVFRKDAIRTIILDATFCSMEDLNTLNTLNSLGQTSIQIIELTKYLGTNHNVPEVKLKQYELNRKKTKKYFETLFDEYIEF